MTQLYVSIETIPEPKKEEFITERVEHDIQYEARLIPKSEWMCYHNDLIITSITDNLHWVVSNVCDYRGKLYGPYSTRDKQYVICFMRGLGGFTQDQQYFRIIILDSHVNIVYSYTIDIERTEIYCFGFVNDFSSFAVVETGGINCFNMHQVLFSGGSKQFFTPMSTKYKLCKYRQLQDYERDRRRFAIQNLKDVKESMFNSSKSEIPNTPFELKQNTCSFIWDNVKITLNSVYNDFTSMYSDNGPNTIFIGSGDESFPIMIWEAGSYQTYTTYFRPEGLTLNKIYRVTGTSSFILELIDSSSDFTVELLIGSDSIDFTHIMWKNSLYSVKTPIDVLE